MASIIGRGEDVLPAKQREKALKRFRLKNAAT